MTSEEDKNRMRRRWERGIRKQQRRDDIRDRRARKRAVDPDDPITRRRRDEPLDDRIERVPADRRPGGDGAKVRRPVVAGRVVELTAGFATVRTDSEEFQARLAPSLRREQQQAVAVGDHVACRRADDGSLVVESVHERRSWLSRPHPGNEHRERVIVANVDLAIIVLSVVRPRLRAGLADRMLVALARGNVAPLLCFNKCDLLEGDADERQSVDDTAALYERLGVPCLRVSAETGAGLDALQDAVRDRTIVFIGHSGVGKSALLNRLDPDQDRTVGTGRSFDGKGRHTTRTARLTHCRTTGAHLIDTPGVRTFGLWRIDSIRLAHDFPDFRVLAPCRFRDCIHVDEPGCSVLAAVADGRIMPARYAAYRKLGNEIA